jgi:hypothetical protein
MANFEREQAQQTLEKMGRRLFGAAKAKDSLADPNRFLLGKPESLYLFNASLTSSEDEVTAEELGQLENTIQTIRGFAFEYGQSGANIPDFETYCDLEWRSEAELERYHALQVAAPFTEAVVEETEVGWNTREEPVDQRLSISVLEENRELTIEFGFHQDFRLTTMHQQPDNPGRIVMSGSERRRLSSMTLGEYTVITSYMELLIEQQEKRHRI